MFGLLAWERSPPRREVPTSTRAHALSMKNPGAPARTCSGVWSPSSPRLCGVVRRVFRGNRDRSDTAPDSASPDRGEGGTPWRRAAPLLRSGSSRQPLPFPPSRDRESCRSALHQKWPNNCAATCARTVLVQKRNSRQLSPECDCFFPPGGPGGQKKAALHSERRHMHSGQFSDRRELARPVSPVEGTTSTMYAASQTSFQRGAQSLPLYESRCTMARKPAHGSSGIGSLLRDEY